MENHADVTRVLFENICDDRKWQIIDETQKQDVAIIFFQPVEFLENKREIYTGLKKPFTRSSIAIHTIY